MMFIDVTGDQLQTAVQLAGPAPDCIVIGQARDPHLLRLSFPENNKKEVRNWWESARTMQQRPRFVPPGLCSTTRDSTRLHYAAERIREMNKWKDQPEIEGAESLGVIHLTSAVSVQLEEILDDPYQAPECRAGRTFRITAGQLFGSESKIVKDPSVQYLWSLLVALSENARKHARD